MTGTLEYLRRPFVANLKAGDKALVLTDTAHDVRVWQAVMSILAELRVEAVLALFEPRPADYYDPPAAVCDAMKSVDCNVLLASTGMLHCPANFDAMAAGVPFICMDGGMTLEMFQSGAVTEDSAAMLVMRHHIGKNVFGPDARTCRVTSRYGTDLTYDVSGRIRTPALQPADFDHFKYSRYGDHIIGCLFPTGEFNVAPVEYSANGKLVIDLTIHALGRLRDHIELNIEDGRIVSIEGGAEAHALRTYLADYGDENAYMCPAEASIGVNRKALIRGVQREDKNIYGAMHFGLGTNIDVGGSIHSSIHMDGVVLEPTLYVDGEMRLEDGRFLVPLGV